MKTRLIILILTFIAFTAQAHVSDNSTKIVSLEKVPIISVDLNGKTAYFVLDSGSDVSLLHLAETESFEFTHQKRAVKSIIGASGGSQPLFEASAVALRIGHQLLQTSFYATDLTTVVESLAASTGIRITGIIGMDLMHRYGFEIDYGNKQLTISS